MDSFDTPQRREGVTPPPSSHGAPAPERAADGRSRSVQTALTLLLLATIFIYLYQFFGADGMLSITKAALGLGFVIFIHELGHFAVAKWCDVHVETFSIGFGPAIPGCSFQRGETLYKIAMFPLGGYVKMVGEGDESEEDDDDPRSFKNKTVGERMAIISAGVIMNLILACVCFVFVYTAHGVEHPPGAIGMVDIGSRAWQRGVPSGATIRQIGNVRNPYFDDLQPEVMLSQAGEKLTLVYSPHDKPQERIEIQIEPRRDKDDTRPVIGVSPPWSLELPEKAYRKHVLPVWKMSAAAQAEPPFEFGDVIVGTTDPDHPEQTSLLPLDLQSGKPDYFVFRERLQRLKGTPIIIQVRRRGATADSPPVDIKVPPAYHYTFGMRMRMGEVTAVRDDSPAAKGDVRARDRANGIEGDILNRVEVTEPDGSQTWYVSARSNTPPAGVTEKDLDPLRLPYELQQWAARKQGERKVTLTVLRQVGHAERKEVPLVLDWDDSWKFNKEVPYSPNSPLSVPELGLAYRVDTLIDAVEPGSPAAKAGLKKGDLIKAIRFQELGKKDGEVEFGKKTELESDQWAYVFWNLQEWTDYKGVSLEVESDGQTRTVELTAQLDPTWPLADRGLILQPDRRLHKAEGFTEAIAMGVRDAMRSVVQIYLNLRAMLTNRVSVKNLGGPIMIATYAYSIAGENIYAFIRFLGLISVNLAVINFLPIPVLDGGHMVFLIYEKLRGRPASEQVRAAATYAGLMLIASLMLFVIYLDVARL